MLLKCFAVSFTFILSANLFQYILTPRPNNFEQKGEVEEDQEVAAWLSAQGLSRHRPMFQELDSLLDCSIPEQLPQLGDDDDQEILIRASARLRDKMLLQHWLDKNGWTHLAPILEGLDVGSLSDLAELEPDPDYEHEFQADLVEAVAYLPPPPESLDQLERLIWDQLVEAQQQQQQQHHGGLSSSNSPHENK